MTKRERLEAHVKTLQKLRRVMLEDEEWERLKPEIEAVTAGGMALQRIIKEDCKELPEEPSKEKTEETITEFADRCKKCGAKYGRLLNQKWIPVSERLPEENKWVLVTVVQGSVRYVEIMRIDKYKGMFTDNVGYYYDSVIAWMPLPEPYKAESEEGK